MSAKNIHLLDNLIEENNYNNTIHALANMGQRMGVKGDSIIYNSLELIDVFNVNLDSNNNSKFKGVKENIDDYIGYLYYVNDDNDSIICKFGVIKKTQLLESKKGYINNSDTLLNSSNNNFTNIDLNIFGELKLNLNENLTIEGINILNNIDSYNKNSIIKTKNNHLYSLLFGNVIGENNYIEIIYNDFDLKNNVLKYALRASKSNNNYYTLYEFDNTNVNTPKLNIYKLNIPANDSSYSYIKNIFDKYFSQENDLNIDIDISNEDNLKESSQFIFEYFFLNYTSYESYNLNYNNDSDTKFSLNENSSVINNNILNKIINRINYINNDINILIPSIIKYYHNNFFSININTVILRILQNIYETMCLKYTPNLNIDNNITNDRNINFNDYKFVLYFPLDYKILCEYNKNNIFEIYHVNDFYINKLNLENYDEKLTLNNDIFTNIIFSSNLIKQSIFDIYNVLFEYNNYYDNNYISNINTIYLNTLPYIDKSNYNWYINGQNSGLHSYLNNSLFQYFVIINTLDVKDNNINGEYLLNIPNDLSNYFSNNEFVVKTFEVSYERVYSNTIYNNINGITDSNNNNESNKKLTVKYSTLVPKIIVNDINDIYQNTLVISLSTITDANLNNILLCTLWKYNGEDWEILKDGKTNDILDLSNFLNLGLLKNRSLNTKNYIFDYLGILLNDKTIDFHNPYGEDNINLAVLEKNNDLGLKLRVISSNEFSIVDNKLNDDIDFDEVAENQQTKYIKLNDKNNLVNQIKKIDRNGIYLSDTTVNTETNIIDDGSNVTSESETQEQTSIIDLKNYKDYTLNNVPLLNISEIIMEHPQILNRLNVISLDKNDIYNTIIGIDIDENEDKKVFAIKPSTLNIDIGTNTLIKNEEINSFNTLDEILIDFKNINLNGSDNIKLNGLNIELNGNVKSDLIRQELTDNSYILYKDLILLNDLIINDSKEFNNKHYYKINLEKLFKSNNIYNKFTENNFNIYNENDLQVKIDENNKYTWYINEDHIINTTLNNDNFYICKKTLRVIKYYNSNNSAKNIIMLV